LRGRAAISIYISLIIRVRPIAVRKKGLALTNPMGRPVLDQTGLTGPFDFTMEYEMAPATPGAPLLAGPSLGAALQDQLGLKLETTKAPVEVLVIDHVEQPTPN
jgi:uncharacterized protein (TIGR03435 family)